MPRPPKNRKEQVGYVFFWKIDQENGIFSQWYPSPITIISPIDGSIIHEFNCAEQYMMYQKAILFNDSATAQKILNETNPNKIKSLGREVTNFDQKIWDKHKYEIVKKATYLKFTQNKKLLNSLLNFADAAKPGSKILFVEASPLDKIWGIGFDKKNALKNKTKWGENLLGVAITEVYYELVNEC